MLIEPPTQNLLLEVPAISPIRQKTPRLERYKGIRKRFENNDADTAKVFVEFKEKIPQPNEFQFIDLFCGASGNDSSIGSLDASTPP